MQGMVAIEWDSQMVRGVTARTGQKPLQVTGSFVLQVPANIQLAKQPQQAGRWLRERLTSEGLLADTALVALPHDQMIVRHLELPQTPAAQMADLVRLQIVTKSPETAENEIIDFLPLPARLDRPVQVVLAVSVPKQRVALIRQVMSAAGLELVSLGYAPLGIAEFVGLATKSQARDGEIELVLALRGPRLEVMLLNRNQLLFCHTARFTDLPDRLVNSQMVLAEITRALVAAQGLMAGSKISAVRLIGQMGDQQRLQTALNERFHCPIQRLPIPDIAGLFAAGISDEEIGELAVPLGMLSAHDAHKAAPINLLAPRRSVVQRDWRKLRVALIAGLLLAVAAAGYFGFRSYVHQLESQKRARQDELKHAEELLERGRPLLESAALIRDWETRSVSWLNEMNRVGEALPDTSVIYLQSWQFELVTGSTVGRIEADGYAAKREDVEQLNQSVAELTNFRVLPREIGQPVSHSPEYPYRFDLDIDLLPAKTESQREASE